MWCIARCKDQKTESWSLSGLSGGIVLGKLLSKFTYLIIIAKTEIVRQRLILIKCQ
jgi:hypothetical protein